MQKRLARIILSMFTLAGGVSGCAAAYEVFGSPSQPLPTLSNPSNSPVSQRSTTNEFAALEQSVHQQINKYRQSRNLPPLALDARISEQSRHHSQAIASRQMPFSHNGFEARVNVIGRSIPYRSAAENVVYNQRYSNPDQQAVERWIKSLGHRKNMEGQFDVTGIGITKNATGEYYFTQIFIKRR